MTILNRSFPWRGCFPAECCAIAIVTKTVPPLVGMLPCGMLRDRDQDDNKLQTLAIYQPIKTK